MSEPRGMPTSSESQGSGNLPQDGRQKPLRRPLPSTQERILNGTNAATGNYECLHICMNLICKTRSYKIASTT